MANNCLVCGGFDFELEDGSRVCSECGAHQLNFVELLDDEEAFEYDKSKFFVPSNFLQDNIEKNKGNVLLEEDINWTTFESFNIILKEWTKTLMYLGASDRFKTTVFKLWISYLQKRKIAFVKNEPSFGNIEDFNMDNKECFFKRDVHLLNKAVVEEIPSKKKMKLNPTDKLGDFKKKLLKHEMKLNGSKFSDKKRMRFIANQMSETLTNVQNGDFLPDNEDDISEEISVMDATKYECQEALEDLVECETNHETAADSNRVETTEISIPVIKSTKNQKILVMNDDGENSRYFKNFGCELMTLEKLLAVVYLALLLTKEDILLLDLLRWCREGHFPFQSAGYLLPETLSIKKADCFIFRRPIPSAHKLRLEAGMFANYMSMSSLPLPSYKCILDKVVHDLNIPEDVYFLVEEILNYLRVDSTKFTAVPSVEPLVCAAVLLSFKIVYGMDDLHEELLSDWADKFNQILEAEKKEYRVFSWRKWHSYLNNVIWWSKQVFPSATIEKEGKAASMQPKYDTKRFSSYFWSQGFWNISMGVDSNKNIDKATWEYSMMANTLGLNRMTIKDAFAKPKLFSASKTPYVGLLTNYLSWYYKKDPSNAQQASIKTAERLSQISFKSHRFNWLLHRHELVQEFKDFNKDIKIVNVPLSLPAKVHKEFVKQQNLDGDSPLRLLIPDPMKSYWITKQKDGLERLPRSFRWFVGVFSDLCETDERDIMVQFSLLEKRYLSQGKVKDRSRNYHK